MPEPYGIETAGSFGVGNTYIIVSVGTTDFTLIGASANRPGIVFESTGGGSGTGTARRLNSQLGRIGGKLLADNLLRNGIDLAIRNTAYDTPVFYLKVDPEVKETVTAGSFIVGIRYRIRTIGTTNYLLWGAVSNTIGTIFTATGLGAGTGTADLASDSVTDTDAADDLDPRSNQEAGSAIGFNIDTPAFDLHIASNTYSTNLIVSNDATIDNLTIENNRVSTTVGPIEIYAAGSGPVALFDRITTQYLIVNENTIESISNQNIRINASGTGTIELTSTTNVDGDLNATGNINITGNLSKQGNLIIGDDVIDGEGSLPENDKVDFNVLISQDLLPGQNNAYDLGGSLGDSTSGRWANAFSPGWTNIQNLLPSSALISDQMRLGDSGLNNVIQAVQSNDDLLIDPDTGIVYIEQLKFQDNDITNLNTSTPITFKSTGLGYYRFAGTNAMIVPAGGDADRPLTSELGDTRWNTDQGLLECFDGTVYVVSTGAGIEVTTEIMEDLGHVYTLMLG
jgi:hypothetical protein